MNFLKKLTPFTLPLLLAACGDDDLDPGDIQAPDVYDFVSVTDPSAPSSVDYREATTRLLLIKELQHLIGSDYLQSVGEADGDAAVIRLLNRVYTTGTKNTTNNLISINLYDDTETPTPIMGINTDTDISSDLPLAQLDFSQLEANINLKDKMPGIDYDLSINDAEGQKQFIGWNLTGVSGNEMPDAMIQDWFETIAEIATDGDLTTKFIQGGKDYQQLVGTFLLGAIGFGQSMQHHLSDSGLSSENTGINDLPYTALQHNWDAAFGYYGAVRHLGTLTDTQIVQQNDHLYTGQSIDLFSEYLYGYAKEASYRDLNATLADTNMAGNTIQSFLNGRKIIENDYNKPITSDADLMVDIRQQALLISTNWESSLAATIIHYINLTAYYTLQYPALEAPYAKYWSTLKGHALALQFNPNSTLSTQDLIDLHELIRQLPEVKLDSSKLVNYSIQLSTTTRNIITDGFKFSSMNATSW